MSMRSAGANDYLAVEPEAEFVEDTYSVIDRHSSFDGTFHSDRDLRIDGEVKGTIECQGTLFVAEGAVVSAKIDAENVTVAGDLNGEILCRGRLQMLPSGRVRGKIATETLVIAEGAYYEGELEMTRPEDRDAKPRRLGNATAAAPVPINGQATEGRASESRAGDARAGGPTTFIRRLGSPETAWDTKPGDEETSSAEAGESGPTE
jgi:cytoskeletal protein CcmA (bactofilin family)